MRHYRTVRTLDEPTAAPAARAVTCPQCHAVFAFCRTATPVMDACGFEIYAMQCAACGASLSGIVDPLDDALLISARAA